RSTQTEARQSHAELYRRQKFVQALLDFLDGPRPQATLLNELLDAGVPDTHHRKLRSHKKRIGGHQQNQQYDPQQHQGNHGANLTAVGDQISSSTRMSIPRSLPK